MKLNPQDLEKITGLTLDHYNQRAEEFWQGTCDHDVKQNIAALLQWIEGEPPFTILDFGRGAVHTCCELHARHATGSSAFTDNDTRPSLCLYFSMPDGRDYQQPHNHEHGHGSELSEMQIRVRALETILTEKGYVDPAALDLLIETYEKKIGPRNGARVVAKAWVDTRYRQWLFEDATAAVESLGYGGNKSEHLIALENTPAVHNIVVCTLCSCYPWSVLGLPPVWYKSAPYRSRTVADPRGVLRDFGVELPKDVEIRVWDSTSEVRYLVVPMRPAATDGWSEERLADLVTRNSMIGTGLPKQIDEVAR